MDTTHASEIEDSIQNNAEFICVSWFGTVGIVLTQDMVTHEFKAYTKDIHKVDGPAGYYERGTQRGDILDIMAWGTKFPIEAAKVLFPWITFDETKYWKESNEHYIL